jgi:hypothetical protein
MATTKVLIRAPQAPERRAAARMTGRYLVTIEPDAHREISTRLNRIGLKAASPLPRVATSAKPLPDGSQLTLRNVGVALVDPKPDQEDALHRFAAQERAVIALEPERIVRAVEVDRASDLYAAGATQWMRLRESCLRNSVPWLLFRAKRPCRAPPGG